MPTPSDGAGYGGDNGGGAARPGCWRIDPHSIAAVPQARRRYRTRAAQEGPNSGHIFQHRIALLAAILRVRKWSLQSVA